MPNHQFNNKNNDNIKLNLNSCKIGFKSRLQELRKELNFDDYTHKYSDILLYFNLEKPQLSLKKDSQNNKFYTKNFSIESSYNSKMFEFEFEIKDINRISTSDKYLHIVEIYFHKGFNTFLYDQYQTFQNKKKFFLVSPFFDLSENQILRNWIQQPILRLEFKETENIYDANGIYNPGIKIFLEFISKIENFRKNNKNLYYNNYNIKKTNFVYYTKFMLDVNNEKIKTILKKYELRILNKLSFLNVDNRFAVFYILSSNVLEYPIDLDEGFINKLIYIHSEDKIIEDDLLGFYYQKRVDNSNNKKYDLISEFFKYFDFNRKRKKYKTDESFFNFLINKITKFKFKYDTKKIKKIIITPNNFIFRYDWLNFTNRILDANRDNEENFLILNFANLNLEKDNYSFLNMHKIVDHFYKILKKGIKIGLDIKFDFLCYSNSQLKSHSIWMIYESDNFNMKKIFEKQGNFENIKNIASNASRRGLCLTSAKFYGKIPCEDVCYNLNDITVIVDESEIDSNKYPKNYLRKEYNFTDGIGQISISLARKISNKLFNCDFASAFQIRIGGYKGVVAVHPDLKGDKIRLRPSMKKFESQCTKLYVIRTSNFSYGFLNKQIIFLLSELGVSNKYFEEMLDNEIKKIGNSLNISFFDNDGADLKLTSEIYNILELFDDKNIINYTKKEKSELNEIKEEIKVLDFIENKDKNRLFEIKKPSKNIDNNNEKIMDNKDLLDLKKKKNCLLKSNPFFKGIYNTILINKLINLKDKCKLFDDLSGKFIGIIDELGVLKKNECFIQIAKNGKTFLNAEVKLGLITITKNPCGYLEDIQVLYGVENKELEKIYFNVIVFPLTSKKPVQTLISGGDLDGDVYFVSWNTNLAPPDLVMRNRHIPSIDYIEKRFKDQGKITSDTNIIEQMESFIDDPDNFWEMRNSINTDEIKNKANKNSKIKDSFLKNFFDSVFKNNFHLNNIFESNLQFQFSDDKNKSIKNLHNQNKLLKTNFNNENIEINNNKINLDNGFLNSDFNNSDFFSQFNVEDKNNKKSNKISKIEKKKDSNKFIDINQSTFDYRTNLLNKNNSDIIISQTNSLKNKEKIDEKKFNDFSMNIESLLDEEQFRIDDLGKNDYRNSLINFFCLYLKNDSLGIICNNLLAKSDLNGVQHEDSLILCIYQRQSVNFFKTGKTILIENLKKIQRWPDFMEKNPNYTYESPKILGILYRKIKKIFENEKENLKNNDLALSIPKIYLKDNLILFPGFEFFTKISWNFYSDYYNELQSYIIKHKLEKEFEFITSIISPIFNFYSKKQIENYDSKLDLSMDSDKFIMKYKRKFIMFTLYCIFLLLKEYDYFILNESYEILISSVFDDINWLEFNKKFKNFNFTKFDEKIFKLIEDKSKTIYLTKKLNKDRIGEEYDIDKEYNYYNINNVEFESIIENNLGEIFFNEDDKKMNNIDKIKSLSEFYWKIKKGFLTSIYFCSYFIFYNSYNYFGNYILNKHIFESAKKYLDREFKEINKLDYEYDSSYDKKDLLKNINFFSISWIIDTKLLLEIKFSE